MNSAYRIADGVGFHIEPEPEPTGFFAHLREGPVMVVPDSALLIVTTALTQADPVGWLMAKYPDQAETVQRDATAYLQRLCSAGFLVRI